MFCFDVFQYFQKLGILKNNTVNPKKFNNLILFNNIKKY